MVNSNLKKSGILVAMLMAAAYPVSAGDWYLGALAGQARGEVGAAEMNQRMQLLGYDAQAEVTNLNRHSWSLLAGYAWSDYLAVELAYTDLGEVRTRLAGTTADIDAYLADANLLHPRTADTVDAVLVGRYPVATDWALLGRLGVSYADSQYVAREANEVAVRSAQEYSLVYGVGFEYELSENWAMRAIWSQYDIEDENISQIGLGFTYRFAQR